MHNKYLEVYSEKSMTMRFRSKCLLYFHGVVQIFILVKKRIFFKKAMITCEFERKNSFKAVTNCFE